jgi:hypothetical protein
MALDLTEILHEITRVLDQATDVESLRRRVHGPLRQAFATLGALE